jgi:DUF4097 and DUF4098 domain-containing protein YvlB
MRIRHALVIAASGLLLTACDWDGFGATTFTDNEALSGPVSEVRFANDSGDVKIAVGDTFEVRRTVGYHETKPGRTYRMDGGALVLEPCPERNCWVDYEVTVPKGTRVNGHLDSGDVDITGVASANVEADSGHITARDVDGEVNAKTSSGNVQMWGIGGPVVVDASSGNITVALDKPRGVTAATSSGNVTVTVPASSYQVRLQGDRVSDAVGDDSTGPSIDLRSNSGDITLNSA